MLIQQFATKSRKVVRYHYGKLTSMRRPPISLLFIALMAWWDASSLRNFKTANPLDLPDMFFITLQWWGLKLEKASSSSSSVVCHGIFPTYMQDEPRRSTSLSLSILTWTARSFKTTEFNATTAAAANSVDPKWINLWGITKLFRDSRFVFSCARNCD